MSGSARPEPVEGPAREDRYAAALLATSLVAGLALRFGFALSDDGIFWADEIFQTLEPAHRLVFGYGLVAWEFAEGARSWALPGAVAALLEGASLVGVSSPRAYLALVRLVFCLASGLTVLGVVALARKYEARWLAAAVGAALLSLMSVAIYWAPRAMSETASAPLLVFGYALALTGEAGRRRVAAGAALVALAVLFRLQCGVFAVGLPALLFARRRWRSAFDALLVLAVGAFFYGLLDLLTWDRWFHSAIAYVQFNLVEGVASHFGTAPTAFYTGRLLASLGPLWVVIAAFGLVGLLRAPGLGLVTLAFCAFHLATPHKELRFLYPAIPFLVVLAGLGVDLFLRIKVAVIGRAAALLAVAAAVGSGATFHRLTFAQLGLGGHPPERSALDAGGPENRLLLAAGEQRELCGLRLLTRELVNSGGYSYLHRKVPLYGPEGPEISSGRYNFVIARRHQVEGREIELDGDLALVQLPVSECVPDPDYDWRLRIDGQTTPRPLPRGRRVTKLSSRAPHSTAARARPSRAEPGGESSLPGGGERAGARGQPPLRRRR